MRSRNPLFLFIFSLIGGLLSPLVMADYQQGLQLERAKASELMQNGNDKDAYVIFKNLSFDAKNNHSDLIASDIRNAVKALKKLGQIEKVDQFLEKVVKNQNNHWQALSAVAQSYLGLASEGAIVSGQFRRGRNYRRSFVNASLRDRARSLQLYQLALPIATSQAKASELSLLSIDYASALIKTANWRLTLLTDIQQLPDYQNNQAYYADQQRLGSPATADGNPLFFALPQSFAAAKNDGERWQWLMQQAITLSPEVKNRVDYTRAVFYHRLYSVKTLSDGYPGYPRYSSDTTGNALPKQSTTAMSVRDLSENESIAKLATGSKRFTLPKKFNYILIWQALAEQHSDQYQYQSLQMLASLFENRQQYLKAANYWRKLLKLSPTNDYIEKRLSAIEGNWGRFETTRAQVADQSASLLFRFRNAKKVHLTAQAIDVDRLIADIKDYIKGDPQKFNHQKLSINNIGYRLVVENDQRYLKKQTASWSQVLKAYPEHFDKQTNIEIPKLAAGAYLVTATLNNGNTSQIVLWLNNTIMLRKNLGDQIFYYVADAASGKPIANAELGFFAYQREYIRRIKKAESFYKITFKESKQYTDAKGSVIISNPSNNLLVTAKAKGKRFAYLGFDRIWSMPYSEQTYQQKKLLLITDRPVYRPGQSVKYKLWYRSPNYGDPFTSRFANKLEQLIVYDAKGEKILEKKIKLDKFGGYQDELELEETASLGVYRIEFKRFSSYGNNSFRVEEYKKPEFEVKLTASQQTVKLGETTKVKLQAKYYYGQPVSHAKVSYKIYRYEHSSRWYPATNWDWLYGSGYWWSAYEYPWYTGWKNWAISSPSRSWRYRAAPAPELVATQTQTLPENGELTILIDTTLAKQLYADKDHRYEIQAEVTDASRRTISSSTSVVVSHKAFKVYAWVDKGYYLAGEQAQAHFKAQTATHLAVQGEGEASLYRVGYDGQGNVKETLVKQWSVKTNEQGEVNKQFIAPNAGQYRIALRIQDKNGDFDSGGYLFNVIGETNAPSNIRFSPLEIITEKRQYRSKETVQLLINTQAKDSTVLLFERPSNHIYQKPLLIQLKGQSAQHSLTLSNKDMPNIFVEALTIRNGQVFTEIREIIIPPENRALTVSVKADKERYQPGEMATLKVKVSDINGQAVVGNTVISVYDAALEYISDGSNVANLRDFFWQWRRYHSVDQLTSVQYHSANQVAKNQSTLQPIGQRVTSSWDRLGNQLNSSRPDKAKVSASRQRESSADKVATFQQGALQQDSFQQSPFQQAIFRKTFADTAFWSAQVKLDKQGRASLRFKMPENLTHWKAQVWSLAHGTRVGQAQTSLTTYKNIILRLQAPRFFVEKDEVVLSANIHNYTDKVQTVQAILQLPDEQLALLGKEKTTQQFEIKPQSEQRVDWRVAVQKEGEAIIRMKALTHSESDAVEMRVPVYLHGIAKTESFSGTINNDNTHASINVFVPKKRRAGSSQLQLQYSPTLAGAMVDALPYLIDYPYGCTEQTLSRFLPTVITQNVLNKMGLDLNAIKNKIVNLNSQQLGDPPKRAKQWQHYKRNPVFDAAQVKKMSAYGVERLAAMQLNDGGWGWFSGSGERASPHTTAYVVHGLLLAKQNGLSVPKNTLKKGIAWLKKYLDRRLENIKKSEKINNETPRLVNNNDVFVFMLLIESGLTTHPIEHYLYRDKNQLSLYAKAMLALAFHTQGDNEKLTQLKRNIEQYLVEDKENQTTYLDLPNEKYWWYWYGSATEANAYYLKLLARTQPKSKKAAGLAKYLINNRKANHWQSTRDTAVIIESLAEYIVASDEIKPDMQLMISIDGKEHKNVQINQKNLFHFDNRLLLNDAELTSGKHHIEIKKIGKGTVYFNAYLNYFSLEDPIKKTGLSIKIERQYFKLIATTKSLATDGAQNQGVAYLSEKYRRVALSGVDSLKSGDLVEVELSIQSKNDYEYILLEDMKPAGFEPVEVRSGYNGNDLGAYVEFRDERVSFFVTRLTRGKHSVSYRMRAQTPGKFSALPARASAMYAPELKANADEIKLHVID